VDSGFGPDQAGGVKAKSGKLKNATNQRG
jgi:hypothetical protein